MEGVEAVEFQVSENITCQLRIAGEYFPVAQGGLKGSGGKVVVVCLAHLIQGNCELQTEGFRKKTHCKAASRSSPLFVG